MSTKSGWCVMSPWNAETGLLGSPLLYGLAPEAVADFLAIAERRVYAAGDRLFHEGECPEGVFVLASGKVKVTRPGPDGKDIIFTMAGAGNLLGELAVFDGGVRHADATAVRETVAALVPIPRMREWLDRYPAASFRMMRLLAERVRRMNDRLEDMAGVDVATRVARALVEHTARFGRHTVDGVRLRLDLSQDELAHHVRASRERVNQVLVEFARRGWIRRDGEEFVVLDADGLTRRARYRPETAQRRPSVPERARGRRPGHEVPGSRKPETSRGLSSSP
ncbi:Crp/Fnr family transcriptional regulator [Nocardia sp. NPDC052566]|uniref:Crp/Fnr family transcriptional regulator n=1 Tax=Nocardia sp. NPDC052566 TaxID=3364330 RepID=UPI0037CAFB17